MSKKDHLEQLLEKLVEEDNASVGHLQRCYQLDREHDHLFRKVEQPRAYKHRFDSAYNTLKTLMEHSNYDRAMALLEYPAKLLKGDIDLLSPSQRDAINELSVTLSKDNRIDPHLLEITQALKLFYEDFYKKSAKPPEVDQAAEKELADFESDPERGAWKPYQDFVDYNKRMQKVDAAELSPEELEKGRPEFFTELNSRHLLEAKSYELKEYLLMKTPWHDRHRNILEHFFASEEHEKLLMICIDILESDLGGVQESFIDEQLRNESKTDLIGEVLQNRDEERLHDMLITSLNQNLDRLMSVLINIIGFDQSYFYQMLAKKGVGVDVYKKILESLFLENTAGGTYGIDGHYAEKLMNDQVSLPKNIIQILQKAMPRGFDGHPLAGSFSFLQMMNVEIEKLKLKKDELDQSKLKDRDYCEHMLTLSDTESIRFIVFMYIFDSLKGGIFPAKIGVSRRKIGELLNQQYDFEQRIGRNRNIVDHINQIWQNHPDLRSRQNVSDAS